VEDVRDGIIAAYRDTFTLPPYNEGEEDIDSFSEKLGRHSARDGFRFVAAYGGRKIVGFDGGEDGWTRSIIARLLSENEVEEWLSDCFEFVDFAVSPEARGRGIGGKLHDELLSGLPHHTSALFAIEEAEAAMGLYRKRRWQTILGGFRFSEDGRAYEVMGLDLRFAL
jgi:GNAT superfamily N-acetyltransferase